MRDPLTRLADLNGLLPILPIVWPYSLLSLLVNGTSSIERIWYLFG